MTVLELHQEREAWARVVSASIVLHTPALGRSFEEGFLLSDEGVDASCRRLVEDLLIVLEAGGEHEAQQPQEDIYIGRTHD